MRVVIFAPSNVHSLELAGLMDVFAEANNKVAHLVYETTVVAEDHEPIRCGSGLRLLPDKVFNEVTDPVDTLLVAGSVGVPTRPDQTVIDWIGRTAPQARRHGSICTGAFLLGDAGLLSGRQVTTHWQYASLLAEKFPDAHVSGDRIFVRDGNLLTSAGSSAAIDLGLTLVEEDLGREVALYAARRLVVFLKRPGDQSQFSVHLAAQSAGRHRIHDVQQYILNNPARDLSTAVLARMAAMSARNFTRVFTQEVGIPPSEYVTLTRLDVARLLLEGTRQPIEAVATKSGFGSARAMRRAFISQIGATPLEYRERFRTSGDGSRSNLSGRG